MIDADDLFETVVLTPEQRRRALALVEEVFAMFTVKNDHLLAYASAVTAGAAPPQPARERAAGGRARRERAAAARRRARRRAGRRWPDGRAARRAEGGAGRAPVPDVALGARRRPARAAARLPAAVDPGHHGLRRPHDLRAGLPAARATRPSGRSTDTPPGSRATTGCSSPTPPRWTSTARSAGARGRPCTSSAAARHTELQRRQRWRRSSRSPSATPARWCATG